MNFIITDEQIEKLKPILPDLDELLKGSYADFLEAIDDAMINQMDSNESIENKEMCEEKLESLYDEICMQNLLGMEK